MIERRTNLNAHLCYPLLRQSLPRELSSPPHHSDGAVRGGAGELLLLPPARRRRQRALISQVSRLPLTPPRFSDPQTPKTLTLPATSALRFFLFLYLSPFCSVGTKVFVGLKAQTKLGERGAKKINSRIYVGFVLIVVDCLILVFVGLEIAVQARRSRRARMSPPGSTPPSTGGSLWGT